MAQLCLALPNTAPLLISCCLLTGQQLVLVFTAGAVARCQMERMDKMGEDVWGGTGVVQLDSGDDEEPTDLK